MKYSDWTFDQIEYRLGRRERQVLVGRWVRDAFGEDTIRIRAMRLLEEAIELFQTADIHGRETALNLVTYVFNRPPGVLEQELGGVLLTCMALAEVARIELGSCEAMEMARVFSKSLDEMKARNQNKLDSGFK